MIENWRIWVIIILMTLSLTDLILTGYYVHKYKEWREVPYNQIELNPLLVFLWSNLGFWAGHIIGSIIILSLIFIVGKIAHPIVIALIGLVLLWAMFNHYTNIGLLKELIIKYPEGVVPKDFLK
jgi:hypothetical protein